MYLLPARNMTQSVTGHDRYRLSLGAFLSTLVIVEYAFPVFSVSQDLILCIVVPFPVKTISILLAKQSWQ